MKAVVDTNVLFSFFWKDSFLRGILMSPGNHFVSPDFALKELDKYSSLIIRKTGISRKEFDFRLTNLKNYVSFVPRKKYGNCLKDAEIISPDKDDKEFFALSMKLDIPLWSNDKLLKNQDKVHVLNTKDILEMIF